MSKKLLARADAIREEYRKKESVPGSGYHDNDRSPIQGKEHVFVAPQRIPDPHRPGGCLPRASEHLVPFFDHDDDEQVHFVGPDAERALAALKAWAERNARRDVVTMPGSERKALLKIIPKLALAEADGLPRLTVRLADWNDVLPVLHAEGIGLSGATLEPAEAA